VSVISDERFLSREPWTLRYREFTSYLTVCLSACISLVHSTDIVSCICVIGACDAIARSQPPRQKFVIVMGINVCK